MDGVQRWTQWVGDAGWDICCFHIINKLQGICAKARGDDDDDDDDISIRASAVCVCVCVCETVHVT